MNKDDTFVVVASTAIILSIAASVAIIMFAYEATRRTAEELALIGETQLTLVVYEADLCGRSGGVPDIRGGLHNRFVVCK